jgi:hypothetical protein
MEQHIFAFFIAYRGRHRKGVAIYNAASINLQPKPWLHRRKNKIPQYYREVHTMKKIKLTLFLS